MRHADEKPRIVLRWRNAKPLTRLAIEHVYYKKRYYKHRHYKHRKWVCRWHHGHRKCYWRYWR